MTWTRSSPRNFGKLLYVPLTVLFLRRTVQLPGEATQLLQGYMYHAETPSGASHSHLSFRHLASTQPEPHRAAMPMAAAEGSSTC